MSIKNFASGTSFNVSKLNSLRAKSLNIFLILYFFVGFNLYCYDGDTICNLLNYYFYFRLIWWITHHWINVNEIEWKGTLNEKRKKNRWHNVIYFGRWMNKALKPNRYEYIIREMGILHSLLCYTLLICLHQERK